MRGILLRIGKITAGSGRSRRRGIVLGHPAAVGEDHVPFDIDAGKSVDPSDVDGDPVFSRRADDLRSEGVFLVIHQYIADRLREHGKARLFFQIIPAPEDDTVTKTLAFPKGGPAVTPLDPAEILLEGEVQLHVARIPDPICHSCLLAEWPDTRGHLAVFFFLIGARSNSG